MVESKQVSQAFLDNSQYLSQSIRQYEWVYGEDFVSPGGKVLAREMIARMAPAAGSKVLDVGCGLGGSAFVMASEFDCFVDGIDLSKNMLEIAGEKLLTHGLQDRVSLKWGDCLEMECEPAYDAVYSRDVFLHIHDKARLFSVLFGALRPGGKLLFTDYCCGPKPWNADFDEYVEQRSYCLHGLEEYAGLVSAAGFEQVENEDLTHRFIDILQSDLQRIAALDIELPQRNYLQQSWQQKYLRATAGDHRWGLFSAQKPE